MAKSKKKRNHKKPAPKQQATQATIVSTAETVTRKPEIAAAGTWLLITLLAFITASFLAWQILKIQNFNYGFWYDTIAIDQTITRYGPENRNRDHFELTNKPEHERLFAAIVTAIHNGGEGLKEITYHHPSGKEIDTLLTEPEVVHLQDVANLVTVFYWVGGISLILTPLLTLLALRRGLSFPALKKLAISWLVVIGAISLATVIIGPVKVFYQLHIWIIPKDHQWFFYYQDSLMTLMMKAPDLFGYIAIAWAVVALPLLFIILLLMRKYSNQLNSA